MEKITMPNITYIPKLELIALNNKAIKLKLNRTLDQEKLAKLPDKNYSPVYMSYATDEHFIRADIGITENSRAFLDILIDDFMSLPSVDIGNPNE
jgi:hypothetical protein